MELYGFVPNNNDNDNIEWSIDMSIFSVFYCGEKPEGDKFRQKRLSICRKIFQDFNENHFSFQIVKNAADSWEPSWKDQFFIFIFAVEAAALETTKNLQELAYNSEYISEAHETRKKEIVRNIKEFIRGKSNEEYAKTSFPSRKDSLSPHIQEKMSLVKEYAEREMKALMSL
jgi:hypothetical protein